MQTETRNATLSDLADLLQDQHARKIDVVAPATSILSIDGHLSIDGADPILEDDGVTITDGLYLPTSVCDEGIAEKLGIPNAYLRKLRENRVDLYDANVNGWLQGHTIDTPSDPAQLVVPADARSFLIRCFRGDDGRNGIARAFLSDRYRMFDNLDVLMSALQGIEDAGVKVVVDGCDVTDRRMYVRVIAPEVTTLAETLLKDYRNPFGDDFDRWRRIADREGLGFGEGNEPVVFAGLVLSNSEVGSGAWSITPRAVIKVCKNGLTLTKDIVRGVHLGGKLEEGVVDWSDDTQEKAVELVRAKTRDAVATFLDADYLSEAIGEIEEKAGQPVESIEKVQVLVKGLSFSNTQMDGILNRFVRGGQMTRGGVMNAITAHAQTIPDADEAHRLEEQAATLVA